MTKNYNKPYLTIVKQLNLLESRGMLVEDKEKASQYLKTISYYRLSGYWFPFRQRDVNNPTIVLDDFIDGVEFQQVVNLYVFDRKLRLLFLDAIERIEVAMRVEIALLLGQRHSRAHCEARFLDKRFTTRITHNGKTRHQNWLEKLDGNTKRSKEHFIKNYKSKYHSELPIWISIELWDFGLMSYFLNGMKDKDKSKIATRLSLPRHDLLTSWIRAINFARNVCAHHARLWNISPADQPKLPKIGEVGELRHLITDKEAQTRIYAHAAIIQYLLKRINPGSMWSKRLAELLNELPGVTGVSEKNMGFPNDWQKLDLWN